jgi:ADP-ribose pyrophosphatase YjhB (NUDIX family)
LAVVSNQRGEVLLVRPSYSPSRWQLPGGYLEANESALDALNRELREELGLEPTDADFVGAYHKVADSNFNLVFGVSLGKQKPRADGNEILECGFFRPDALPQGSSTRAAIVISKVTRGEIPFILVFESSE